MKKSILKPINLLIQLLGTISVATISVSQFIIHFSTKFILIIFLKQKINMNFLKILI